MNKMWIVVSICLFLPLTGCTQNKNKIPYCANTQTTETENSVIQKLVPSFAKEMGCEAGSNCLLKWNDHASEKFSIAWKNRCGPVINGVYQLGDEGRGQLLYVSTITTRKYVVGPWDMINLNNVLISFYLYQNHQMFLT